MAGLVDTMETGDYLITEIFLPKQDCSIISAKSSPGQIMEVAKELMARPKGDRLIEKLRFWGHSHAEMERFASTQDEAQMEAFSKNCDFFIRGILNKRQTMKFDLFLYDKQITVVDVPWFVNSNIPTPNRQAWRSQLKSKVKGRKFLPPRVRGEPEWARQQRLRQQGYGGLPCLNEQFGHEQYNHERGFDGKG